ncbi:MAG: hypothetical protein QM529_00205 [Hydrotalea sp.]|nr:hypothetical protein [Hydrotalea sp.]
MLKILLRAIAMPPAMVVIILLGSLMDDVAGNASARTSEPNNDVVYVRIKPSNQSNIKDNNKEAMTEYPRPSTIIRGGR